MVLVLGPGTILVYLKAVERYIRIIECDQPRAFRLRTVLGGIGGIGSGRSLRSYWGFRGGSTAQEMSLTLKGPNPRDFSHALRVEGLCAVRVAGLSTRSVTQQPTRVGRRGWNNQWHGAL